MARASVWAFGSALAYRGLDLDAQADLLALFQAARMEEGREAKETLQMAVAEPVQEWLKSRKGDGPAAPPSVTTPKSHGPVRSGVPGSELPAILRPRLSPDALVTGS